MKKTQKPAEGAAAIDPETKLTIYLIIPKIREMGTKLPLKQVKELYPKVDIEKLIQVAKTHEKLKYNEKEEAFELKAAYPIKNQNELWRLLVESREGIIENDDLLDCYLNCKSDLEDLKKRDLVTILESNERKFNVLFGVESPDHDVVVADYKKLEKDALDAMREVWDTEIPPASEAERKAYLEKEGIDVRHRVVIHRAHRPAEKEEKKRSRHKKMRESLLNPDEEEKK